VFGLDGDGALVFVRFKAPDGERLDRFMTTRITSTLHPPMVEVRLSDAPVECECAGDVIADVNRLGNWIRGLELLGSAGFSLEWALAPFSPKLRAASVRSPQAELAVTYDGEADAGFLYLPYASPASVERGPMLLEYSHSIEDDSATLGLSADKGLVFVRFRVPPREQLDAFLQLFGSPQVRS
jgi:hypothetical protein